MIERTFSAMGCEIVVRGGTDDAYRAVRSMFTEREQIFSRFVPGSELNRVNASAGAPTVVSPIFAETLRVAFAASAETGGLVNPCIGAALVSAGYTQDSPQLAPDPDPAGPGVGPGSVRSLGRIVARAPGTILDLNGVVKSLAVDDALALLKGDGSVSAGGDLATRGALTVALPGGGVAELREGALATSGSTKRWWIRAGEVQHHLIDPRTGRPARSPWAEVTACGATCVAADVAAKAGFLLGDHGPAWLDARAIPARFVRADGSIQANATWDRSMHEAVPCI